MPDHIDWEDVIEEAISDALGGVHTIVPATLTAYDHATQTGSISFDLRTLWVDAETDAEEWIKVTGVSGVPVVMHPSFLADLEPGTRGLALICERDIDRWKASGGSDVTPADPAKFNRNDAIFLPGIYPGTPNPDARDGATVLPSSDIRLGSPDATAPVAREPEVASALLESNRRIAALEAQLDAITLAQAPVLQPLLILAFPALGATTPVPTILALVGDTAAAVEPPVTGLGSTTTKVE
jgi:hypothetical protein